MAELLNKSADAETFYNRSKHYKNVWNKERELMCPRSKSGEFHCPLDPTLNTWIVKDDGFTEGEHGGLYSRPPNKRKYMNSLYGTRYDVSDFYTGNPEQWRWFVPHDVPGLVSLFKSKSSFISHLSEFFEGSMKHPSNFLPNPYYWYLLWPWNSAFNLIKYISV